MTGVVVVVRWIALVPATVLGAVAFRYMFYLGMTSFLGGENRLRADHRRPDQWKFFVVPEKCLPCKNGITPKQLERCDYAVRCDYKELAENVTKVLKSLPKDSLKAVMDAAPLTGLRVGVRGLPRARRRGPTAPGETPHAAMTSAGRGLLLVDQALAFVVKRGVELFFKENRPRVES